MHTVYKPPGAPLVVEAAAGTDIGPFPAWVWPVGVLGLVALWVLSPQRVRARRNPSRSKRRWIKRAIKRPGAYRASVQRRWGKAGFTKRGTIKPEVIAEDVGSSDPRLRKMAVLARTLKGM